MKVIYQKTKTLVTKPNNNSSDAIAPNHIWGCAGGCGSYCYMKRYNQDKIYVNTNIDQIAKSVHDWIGNQPWPKFSNQQDSLYYIIDIGCNTDMALHQKHLTKAVDIFCGEKSGGFEWKVNGETLIFDTVNLGLYTIMALYNTHEKIKTTFATKYSHMLTEYVGDWEYSPGKKPRVRISLMPQIFSDVLEPNTTPIMQRISDINRLQDLGWEVHLNFSPVIVYKDWLNHYNVLFKFIKKIANLENVKSEVIFLTNHKHSMLNATPEVKEIIKYSSEVKNNKGVMRYPIAKKREYVKQFQDLHNDILGIPIRYIF